MVKKKDVFHGTITGEKIAIQSFLQPPKSDDHSRNEIIGKVSSEGALEFSKPVWFGDDTNDDYEKFWIKRDDLNSYCDSLSVSNEPFSMARPQPFGVS